MKMISIKPRLQEWVTHVVRNERIAHAYLFVGKKGAGKKQTALFFAQTLLCKEKENDAPCGQCNDCLRIAHLNHPDVHWVAREGLSIKIEQVRHLQKEFSYRGLETDRKVYVLESVETMTRQAANSLLKFLEEPHPGTTLLLLTENRRQLLPTIISRCQEVHFPPPDPGELSTQLANEFDRPLAYLAAHMTTDLEEATALCQAEWFAELKEVVIQLTEEIQHSSARALFLIHEQWLSVAGEKEQTDMGLDMLLFWYKDILYKKLHIDNRHVFVDQTDRLHKQGLAFTEEQLTQGLTAILAAKRKLHAHVHPQFLLEQLVLRLPQPGKIQQDRHSLF